MEKEKKNILRELYSIPKNKAALMNFLNVEPFEGPQKLKMQFLYNFLCALLLAPVVWWNFGCVVPWVLTDFQDKMTLSDYELKRWCEMIRTSGWVLYSVSVVKWFQSAFLQYVKYEKRKKRDELEKKMEPTDAAHCQPAFALPPELDTPQQLLPILERGQKAGFLDNGYKPIPGNMTQFQQKRFALLACIEAKLNNYCSIFGKMWKCDYNRVDESRGAAKKRAEIDRLFSHDVIEKARLK